MGDGHRVQGDSIIAYAVRIWDGSAGASAEICKWHDANAALGPFLWLRLGQSVIGMNRIDA